MLVSHNDGGKVSKKYGVPMANVNIHGNVVT